MRYLDESYWHKLRMSSDGKFDGNRFENLVEVLLLEEFGPGWIMTKRTRDGGKDFVRYVEKRKHWAEAKFHRSPIQLKVVANTLVMAIVEDVHRILLFSYSRLTDITKQHLAMFRKSSEAEVVVYDDEVLELLILKHLKRLDAFFDVPKVEAEIPVTQAIHGDMELEIERYITKDIDFFPLPGQDIPCQPASRCKRVHNIDRGALVVYDILARNLTDQNLPAVVDLTSSEVCADFILTNRDLSTRMSDLRLAPGEIELVRLLFRPSTKQEKGSIGGILLRTPTREYPLPREDFHLSSFYRPPLVGQLFRSICSDFEVFASIRQHPIVCAIAGESGSGKTRLVETLMEEAAANGYQCHLTASMAQMSGRIHPFISLVISKIFKLPVFAGEDLDFASSEKSGRSPHLVERVLYDPGFDPALALDDLAIMTAQRMVLRPCILVCDDVQQLDSLGIQFLSKTMQALFRVGSSGGFLLVFNTNEIPFNPEAGALLQYMSHHAERQPGTHRKYTLSDFGEKDAKDFLNAMISPFTDEQRTFTDVYPQTTRLLLSRIVNRPLHLYHTFKFLEERDVLGRTAERFYVSKPESLDSTLCETPREIRDLVALRWEACLSRRPEFARIMAFMSLFREMHLPHLMDLVQSSEPDSLQTLAQDVDALREAGFLAIRGQGHVGFFHGQIGAYFIGRYAWPDEPIAQTAWEFLRRRSLEAFYYQPFFSCLNRLGRITAQDVRTACARISRLNHDEQSLTFAAQVRTALFENAAAMEPASLISTLLDISRHARRMRGYKEQNARLAEDLRYLLSNGDMFRPAGRDVAKMFHEYASSHIGLNENATAEEVIADGLAELPRFLFESLQDRALWEGLLLNRRCVTAKSLLLPRDAVAYGLRSLRIGRNMPDMVLVFRNLIDLGYVYYDARSRLPRVLRLWSQAVRTYDSCREKLPSEQATAELMRARLELLQGRPEQCIAVAETETARAMGRMDSFHAIKGMILQSVAYLAMPKATDEQLRLAGILLDKSIDWSARYASNRFYWMAFYAQAKLARLHGDEKQERSCYILAMEQLLRTHDEHGQYRMRYFFDDVFQVFSGQPKHMPDWLVEGIASPAIRAKMQALKDLRGLEGEPPTPSSPIQSVRLGNLPGI